MEGEYLMVSSIDGFCTIVTLDIEKLGTPHTPSSQPSISMDTCSTPAQSCSLAAVENHNGHQLPAVAM